MKITLFNKDQEAQSVPAGTILFNAGDAGHEMFAVLSGAVDLTVNHVVIETVGAGGVFGEMALIEDNPRTATAIVQGDARIVRIDKKRFAFLVQQNPFFPLQLMAIMAARLRRMNARL